MSFVWNPKAKAGARIVSAKIGGQPLDKGRSYTVATNNYAAGGGDGYKDFKKGKVLIDASGATLLASMVMDYIKAKGTVSPKIEGRIVAQ
jgi:2',3'-cyclic-nucleotide 2'-phosphodiesterase (5'-nucleotidase family)